MLKTFRIPTILVWSLFAGLVAAQESTPVQALEVAGERAAANEALVETTPLSAEEELSALKNSRRSIVVFLPKSDENLKELTELKKTLESFKIASMPKLELSESDTDYVLIFGAASNPLELQAAYENVIKNITGILFTEVSKAETVSAVARQMTRILSSITVLNGGV